MRDPATAVRNLTFVGFGEAAMAFLGGWGSGRPTTVAAYDVKTESPATRAGMEARYAAHAVLGGTSLAAALDGAEAVFSVVTADRALDAATAAATCLPAGAVWLDCNSCAPDTKRRAAAAIEHAGGRYVDVAVMAPVHPKRHRVPLLISGPHAEAAAALLRALDMRPEVIGSEIGAASTVKMLRSIMIKGQEALCAECFLAARRAGVADQVIESLEASDPGMEWRRRGAYNLERMMAHGARRAAEMREVVATIESLGLAGRMSRAAAGWQDEIAALGERPDGADLGGLLDRLLARL
ncbi:MAG: DUF1932 domain-containing protein [Geminicoccaceae bacterium]